MKQPRVPLERLYSLHSGFGLENFPFGVFSSLVDNDGRRRIGSRIGWFVVDLAALAEQESHLMFSKSFAPEETAAVRLALSQSTLNSFADLGPGPRKKIRKRLRDIFTVKIGHRSCLNKWLAVYVFKHYLLHIDDVTMHLPFDIGDYTDFYAGYYHAFNVGCMFRGPENALNANYKELPVGYHGRSSSVVVSDTPIKRPKGQIIDNKRGDGMAPAISTGPTKKLDFEVELGCFIGRGNAMGESIPVDEAESHIFGYVLLNDWSARDIQSWEYVPLGPFNGKNFATSVSPWVVTPEALRFSMTAVPAAIRPSPQRYLREKRKANILDIKLTMTLNKGYENLMQLGGLGVLTKPRSGEALMWSFPQMIAHHTLGGCPMRPGDLLGSGTISGNKPHKHSPHIYGSVTFEESRGSLLEISENGCKPFQWPTGAYTQKLCSFLDDGDVVQMTASAFCRGEEIGFGELRGRIVAATGMEDVDRIPMS